MDNFDLVNFSGDESLPQRDPELDKPIPFDDSDPEPAAGQPPANSGVSRKPLSLGGAGGAATPSKPAARPTAPAPQPAAATAQSAPARPTRPVSQASVGADDGRIRGVKTFFTKLHPGAIVFLDEQVHNWLKDNPDVTIKRTNITVGEVQAKKTEPNLIVMVWY